MLKWSLIFFILAIVAAVFGFGGIAGTAAFAAKLLFGAFILVAVMTAVSSLFSGKLLN